jgi:hypothetical protein
MQVEEEAFIDSSIYDFEYAADKNISSFNKALKTLHYGEAELFTNFGKTLEDTCKDLRNNLIGKVFKYSSINLPGLQTTTNFKKALTKYQDTDLQQGTPL